MVRISTGQFGKHGLYRSHPEPGLVRKERRHFRMKSTTTSDIVQLFSSRGTGIYVIQASLGAQFRQTSREPARNVVRLDYLVSEIRTSRHRKGQPFRMIGPQRAVARALPAFSKVTRPWSPPALAADTHSHLSDNDTISFSISSVLLYEHSWSSWSYCIERPIRVWASSSAVTGLFLCAHSCGGLTASHLTG